MRDTKAMRKDRFFADMAKRGFSFSEATTLRRIEMTLHKWAEGECGDSSDYASTCIVRDDKTGKPYRETLPHSSNKRIVTAIPDKEAGALKRLAKLMESHPDYVAYHQGDCRGCMLYILTKADLKPGDDIYCLYTRGFAVCY